MPIEAERLVAIIEAKLNGIEKAVNGLQRGKKAFEEFGNAGEKAERVMKTVGAQTGIIAAQFQDIAVQLQGGASPFTVALQQGTQLTGALGNNGLRGALSGLAGGFTSLLSPISLVTVATIAAGGSLLQYFTGAEDEGGKAEKTIREHEEAVRAISDRWGEAFPALKKYADEAERLKALNQLEAVRKEGVRSEHGGVEGAIDTLEQAQNRGGLAQPQKDNTPQFRAYVQSLADVITAYDDLKKAQAEGSTTTGIYERLQKNLSALMSNELVPATGEWRDALRGLSEEMMGAAKGAGSVNTSADLVKQFEAVQAAINAVDTKTVRDGLQSLFDDVRNGEKTVAEVNVALSDLGKSDASLEPLLDAFRDLFEQMAAGRDAVKGLVPVQEVFGSIKTAIDTVDAEPVRKELQSISDQAQQNKLSVEEVQAALKKLAADNPGEAGPIAFLGKLIETAVQAREAIESIGQVRLPEMPSLSPLYSQGGKFTDEAGAPAFTFDDAAMQKAANSAAAMFIRQFESYAQKAYPDKRTSTGKFDAWRVGFGSDTATRGDGSIERVTQATVVSLADANRDLGRRIVEFQNTIKGQIGNDTFASLNENQQGALTSIAYNYGRLPQQIVQAILSGQGQGAVANAIAGLGANPSRRKQEAELYGGAQFSAREPRAARAPKKTPDQIYDLDIEKAEGQIRVLQAVVAAQGGLKAAVDQTAVAVEAARIKQQLLNEAQKAGVAITPELTAKAGNLATQLATLKAQQDANTVAQRDLNQASQEYSTLAKDVMGGFINDLVEGKSASEALANALGKIGDKLLDLALNAIFDGGGGGLLSNLFGGLFGGKRAKGGPVAAGKTYLIGEKGPEAFTPGRSGVVTPNDMLAGPPPPARIPKGPAGGGYNDNRQFHVDARGAQKGVAEEIQAALAAYDSTGAQRFARDYKQASRRGMV